MQCAFAALRGMGFGTGDGVTPGAQVRCMIGAVVTKRPLSGARIRIVVAPGVGRTPGLSDDAGASATASLRVRIVAPGVGRATGLSRDAGALAVSHDDETIGPSGEGAAGAAAAASSDWGLGSQ